MEGGRLIGGRLIEVGLYLNVEFLTLRIALLLSL